MNVNLTPNITGKNVNIIKGATQADLTNSVNNSKTYRDEAEAFSIVSEAKSVEASYSALNASISSTTASDKATIATTKANEANNSAINASASEAVCIAKATITTDKANIATAQSVIATDKANEASVSANAATTQAGIATTKASEASTSASNALTSENNADTSEANALIYRNQAESFANSINHSDLVHISGTETITGNKTFTGTVTLPSTTSIGTISSTELGYIGGVTSNIQTQLDSKNPNLVSGTNIKTINGSTILESGNINLVDLTTNQTIDGVKTFSSSPIVPTPTTGTQAVNKDYVDSVAKWNNETEYLAGASVQHSGNVWICEITNINSEPTDLNANWEKVAINKDLTLTVDTIADLRSISYPANTVWASGYHTKNDGAFGSHIFRLKGVKTTETDNGGTVIVATISGVDYVYELQYDGAVNVKWFGAKGDGVTDDTISIRTTVNYCLDNNTAVYVPSSIYLITDTIHIKPKTTIGKSIKIFGDGAKTIFKFMGVNECFIIDYYGYELITDGTSLTVSVSLCDFSIVGNSPLVPNHNGQIGIYMLSAPRNSRINNVYIQEIGTGIKIGAISWEVAVSNCVIFNANKGVDVVFEEYSAGIVGHSCNGSLIERCSIMNSYYGIVLGRATSLAGTVEAPNSFYIKHNTINGAWRNAIICYDGDGVVIDSNYLEINSYTEDSVSFKSPFIEGETSYTYPMLNGRTDVPEDARCVINIVGGVNSLPTQPKYTITNNWFYDQTSISSYRKAVSIGIGAADCYIANNKNCTVWTYLNTLNFYAANMRLTLINNTGVFNITYPFINDNGKVISDVDIETSGVGYPPTTATMRLGGLKLNNKSISDSSTLDWYEEIVFTPTLGGSWSVEPTSLSGKATRVGNIVTLTILFHGGSKTSSTSGWIGNIPFAISSPSSGIVVDTSVVHRGQCLANNTDKLWLTNTSFYAGANVCSITYFTS